MENMKKKITKLFIEEYTKILYKHTVLVVIYKLLYNTLNI